MVVKIAVSAIILAGVLMIIDAIKNGGYPSRE